MAAGEAVAAAHARLRAVTQGTRDPRIVAALSRYAAAIDRLREANQRAAAAAHAFTEYATIIGTASATPRMTTISFPPRRG